MSLIQEPLRPSGFANRSHQFPGFRRGRRSKWRQESRFLNTRETEVAVEQMSMLSPKPKIMRIRINDAAPEAIGKAIVESPHTRDPMPITAHGPNRSTIGPMNASAPVYDQFHPARI